MYTMQVYVEGRLCRDRVDVDRRQVDQLVLVAALLLQLVLLFAEALQELHPL